MHYVYLYSEDYAIIVQGDTCMERKPSKNDALEALDFIINVLKEHEKDLDSLINQLGVITESLVKTGDISGKIEKIEENITILQDKISGLTKNISSPTSITPSKTSTSSISYKCNKWEDFKNLAIGSETLSYTLRVSDNSFKADALRDGKIISYFGELPSNSNLLKLWLSNELKISIDYVFEGILNMN